MTKVIQPKSSNEVQTKNSSNTPFCYKETYFVTIEDWKLFTNFMEKNRIKETGRFTVPNLEIKNPEKDQVMNGLMYVYSEANRKAIICIKTVIIPETKTVEANQKCGGFILNYSVQGGMDVRYNMQQLINLVQRTVPSTIDKAPNEIYRRKQSIATENSAFPYIYMVVVHNLTRFEKFLATKDILPIRGSDIPQRLLTNNIAGYYYFGDKNRAILIYKRINDYPVNTHFNFDEDNIESIRKRNGFTVINLFPFNQDDSQNMDYYASSFNSLHPVFSFTGEAKPNNIWVYKLLVSDMSKINDCVLRINLLKIKDTDCPNQVFSKTKSNGLFFTSQKNGAEFLTIFIRNKLKDLVLDGQSDGYVKKKGINIEIDNLITAQLCANQVDKIWE
jgi:hypothetical protein